MTRFLERMVRNATVSLALAVLLFVAAMIGHFLTALAFGSLWTIPFSEMAMLGFFAATVMFVMQSVAGVLIDFFFF